MGQVVFKWHQIIHCGRREFEYSQRSNIQTSEGDWYRKDYDNVWRMNVEIHEDALDRVAAFT